MTADELLIGKKLSDWVGFTKQDMIKIILCRVAHGVVDQAAIPGLRRTRVASDAANRLGVLWGSVPQWCGFFLVVCVWSTEVFPSVEFEAETVVMVCVVTAAQLANWLKLLDNRTKSLPLTAPS